MGWNDTQQELPPQIAAQLQPNLADLMRSAPQADAPVFDTSSVQQPQAPASTGIKGFLSNMFKNFMAGASEAGAEASGLNEAELRKAQTAHLNSQTGLVNKQIEMLGTTVPVTLPDGTSIRLPAKMATDILGKRITAQGKVDAATAGNKSRERMNDLNAHLKGLNAGVEIGQDENGEFTWKNIPKENLPAGAQSKKSANEIGLILAANNGDPDAKKALDVLQGNRMSLVRARGDAFGKARLWALQRVYDPATGQSSFMTGFGVLQAQDEGRLLIPVGGLSQKDVVAVQQLQSEAAPAIKGVRENIRAFDNPGDRAVYARVMKSMGAPDSGKEATWMGNVVNQALKEGLSPEGQKQAMSLARLAETMGRLRSTLGLPATEQSMALSLSLLPGASTPNANYAKGQIDQLEDMIKQAVTIPAYGGAGATHGRGTGNTPPPGAKVRDYTNLGR